ncbi:MAG: outer rane adhesin like protein [Candidatus Taylorbacteria bacterium]|nr:outer rane adhesin like protein [Candidatus Taylorbacteria bacterium]
MKNIFKSRFFLFTLLAIVLFIGNVDKVFATNSAPGGTNLSAAETYTEDTALNLIDIVTSDVDSDPLTVTLILSNPAAGSLNTGTSGAVTSTYNAGTGVWTASGAISSVNTLLAGLTFTPTSNYNSNFTISTSVSDGIAPAVTGSKAMTGIPINDAPVLDASRTPTMIGINGNASAPVGVVGTPVSSLIDMAIPAGGVDNVTDPDSGASTGIAITATDINLTCFYTLDGGTTWSLIGAVSASSARLLASNSNNRVYCEPNLNQDATYSAALTFRAWDQTSGTDGSLVSTASSGGTTAFSAATDTIGLTVTAVAVVATHHVHAHYTPTTVMTFGNTTAVQIQTQSITRIQTTDIVSATDAPSIDISPSTATTTPIVVNFPFQFTKDFHSGNTDPEIKLLQKYLNAHGFLVATNGPGSLNSETEYFGKATRDALIKLQNSNGISPALGYFGTLTRKFVNSH